jgi:ATP-binding cassette subfamily C (CFTR/MRP) protein 1
MTALMRLVELDGGQILLDGVDTRTLGLRNLRSAIAVIPQDPVLFSGTVGDNLDPFNTYTQDRLTEVLQRVGLMSTSNSKVQSLADPVMEGGNNFSVGEKQLLVIARALLSRASLIICDEATAAVDAETDSMIQKILKSEFQNATCLTIAHRLNTIMDSDMILVMNDGKAAEFNSPQVLLEQDGIFKTLVQTWEEQHGH